MSFNSACKKIDASRRQLVIGALALAAAPAWAAAPDEVRSTLGGARLVGQGRFRYFGMHIYDAALWSTAAGEPVVGGDALALELRYARALKGRLIAERSLQEMQRVASFSAEDGQRWLQDMQRLFPDVADGDRLTGVHRPEQGVRFFHNGALRGEVRGETREAEFAKLFFGIWLSPRTSQPALRLALLGKAPSEAPGGS